MTPSLRDVQRWFQLATTRPGDLEAGVLHSAVTHGFGSDVETVIHPGQMLSAFDRLAIYHSGYRTRLLECLADDFPALKYALGEAAFDTLGRDYIEAHGSRSRTLNAYGQHMARLCERLRIPHAAFLAQLARLEWALIEVVHEPSVEQLTFEHLQTLSPDQFPTARLIPSPALRVLRFDFPINDYYTQYDHDLAPAIPAFGASAVAVFRRGLTVWRHDLAAPAAVLAESLVGGETLSFALSSLDQYSTVTASEVQAWFRSWLGAGWFSGIQLVTAAPQ